MFPTGTGATSVSEELNSVETRNCIRSRNHKVQFQKNLIVWKPGDILLQMVERTKFQKNLIVWKLCCDEKGHIIKSCFRRT